MFYKIHISTSNFKNLWLSLVLGIFVVLQDTCGVSGEDMVGGGSRRDEGLLMINNNVFAVLESLKKKKKSDKERGSSKSKGSSKAQEKEPEPQVFWQPARLTVKSWADVDDDDDYYATTAPPQSVWGTLEQSHTMAKSTQIEVCASISLIC